MANNRAIFNPLQSVAYGSITNSFTLVGSNFSNPVVLIHLLNLTNQSILFNVDGSGVAQGIVAPGGFVLFDLNANRQPYNEALELPIGGGIYIEYPGSAPTSGTFYVTTISRGI